MSGWKLASKYWWSMHQICIWKNISLLLNRSAYSQWSKILVTIGKISLFYLSKQRVIPIMYHVKTLFNNKKLPATLPLLSTSIDRPRLPVNLYHSTLDLSAWLCDNDCRVFGYSTYHILAKLIKKNIQTAKSTTVSWIKAFKCWQMLHINVAFPFSHDKWVFSAMILRTQQACFWTNYDRLATTASPSKREGPPRLFTAGTGLYISFCMERERIRALVAG